MYFLRSLHSVVDQSSDIPLLRSDSTFNEDWRDGQFDQPSYFGRGELPQIYLEKSLLDTPPCASIDQTSRRPPGSRWGNDLKDLRSNQIGRSSCNQSENSASQNDPHVAVAKLSNTSESFSALGISCFAANNRTEKELISATDGGGSSLEWPSKGRVEKGEATAGLLKVPSNLDHPLNCTQEQYPSKLGLRSVARHSAWEGNHLWNGVPAPLPGLRRESSGGSFTDSLASTDCQAQVPSPSRSCNPNDFMFCNALDALYKQDGRRGRQGQYDESLGSLAQQTEQSYNLQLALALRLMADAELTEEPGLLDSSSEEDVRSYYDGRKSVLATAHRFWVNGTLGYSDRIQDGFYQIWGINPYVWTMCNDMDEGGRMPSLESLLAVDPSESQLVVVLIDSKGDMALQDLMIKAQKLKAEASKTQQLAEQLGKLVSMHMGGPVANEQGSLTSRWRLCSRALKTLLGRVVLPIGSLTVGLCRHRALLFKALCDRVGLPCRVAQCCKICGSDEGASCVVICEVDREYYIDLVVNPGALLEHDCFLNSSSLPIASPLRLPDFRSSGLSDEDISWGENLAFNSAQQQVLSHMTNEGFCEPYELQSGTHFSRHSGQALNQQCALWSNMEPVDSEDQAIRTVGGCPTIFPVAKGKSSSLFRQAKSLNETDHQPDLLVDPIGKKVIIAKPQRSTITSSRANIQTSCNLSPKTKPVGAAGNFPGPSLVDPVASQDSWEIPWGEITLKERIGAGSFGTVHRADWHGSDVAVKILIQQDFFEEQINEFMREVEIMKRMRHPNVVLFMGAVTKHPNFSIVTEFLPRGSLFRLLHKPGARRLLDEKRRLRMALDVAKGMNYLHRSNPPIVHRDLKSPNLLVDKNWTVKVGDFGLSRLKANTSLSSCSGAGTPEWMAPEVLRDEPSNEKSDVYSFGVILWELITLQQPWNGMSAAQVVGAVGFQKRRLQIPKDMTAELVALIESCWDSDPSRRPSFANIMLSLKQLQKSSMAPN